MGGLGGADLDTGGPTWRAAQGLTLDQHDSPGWAQGATTHSSTHGLPKPGARAPLHPTTRDGAVQVTLVRALLMRAPRLPEGQGSAWSEAGTQASAPMEASPNPRPCPQALSLLSLQIIHISRQGQGLEQSTPSHPGVHGVGAGGTCGPRAGAGGCAGCKAQLSSCGRCGGAARSRGGTAGRCAGAGSTAGSSTRGHSRGRSSGPEDRVRASGPCPPPARSSGLGN